MKVMDESETLGKLAAEGLKKEERELAKAMEAERKKNKRLRRKNKRLRRYQRKRSREALEKENKRLRREQSNRSRKALESILSRNEKTAEELRLIEEESRLRASKARRRLNFDEEEEYMDMWSRIRETTLMRWAREEVEHVDKKARGCEEGRSIDRYIDIN